MQIYLMFLILLSIFTIGIFINISIKNTNVLLKDIKDTIEEKPIKEKESEVVYISPNNIMPETNKTNKANKNLIENHNYDDLFSDEDVFFVQEIQLDSKSNTINLDITK